MDIALVMRCLFYFLRILAIVQSRPVFGHRAFATERVRCGSLLALGVFPRAELGASIMSGHGAAFPTLRLLHSVDWRLICWRRW